MLFLDLTSQMVTRCVVVDAMMCICSIVFNGFVIVCRMIRFTLEPLLDV